MSTIDGFLAFGHFSNGGQGRRRRSMMGSHYYCHLKPDFPIHFDRSAIRPVHNARGNTIWYRTTTDRVLQSKKFLSNATVTQNPKPLSTKVRKIERKINVRDSRSRVRFWHNLWSCFSYSSRSIKLFITIFQIAYWFPIGAANILRWFPNSNIKKYIHGTSVL